MCARRLQHNYWIQPVIQIFYKIGLTVFWSRSLPASAIDLSQVELTFWFVLVLLRVHWAPQDTNLLQGCWGLAPKLLLQWLRAKAQCIAGTVELYRYCGASIPFHGRLTDWLLLSPLYSFPRPLTALAKYFFFFFSRLIPKEKVVSESLFF